MSEKQKRINVETVEGMSNTTPGELTNASAVRGRARLA
jgi:hypothetical protein